MFHTLPKEIKLSIFSFLAPKEVKNIFITDKTNSALKENYFLQQLSERFGVLPPQNQKAEHFYHQLANECNQTINLLTALALDDGRTRQERGYYHRAVDYPEISKLKYDACESTAVITFICERFSHLIEKKNDLYAYYTGQMNTFCKQKTVNHGIGLIKALCKTNSANLLNIILKRSPTMLGKIEEQKLMLAALQYHSVEVIAILAPQLQHIDCTLANHQTYLSWSRYLTTASRKYDEGKKIVKLLIDNGASPITETGDRITWMQCNSSNLRSNTSQESFPELHEFNQFLLNYRKEEKEEENTNQRRRAM